LGVPFPKCLIFKFCSLIYAILLAQVSEGLDFADRAGRAVIVTGMPFATPTDPKVCFYLYDVVLST